MRNRENLNASAPCRRSQFYSFEWQSPIDKHGKPYAIGYRICKNFDCVEPAHITRSRFIAKRVYGYLPKLHRAFTVVPVEIEVLIRIAKPVDRYNSPKTCQVPDCDKPHRGLHLCNAHHGQLYRHRAMNGKPKRIKRDNSDIQRYMIPAQHGKLSIKERYCHYPNCDLEYCARGLCKKHYKRWLKWRLDNVRKR